MRTTEDESQIDSATEAGKKDPRDFALWKAAKPEEPVTASWDSPWGRGRPGWHLECSAMSYRYLGETFDIHGGGIDLRFPHHENEQAQSHAAGWDFAQLWVHNAWVTTKGEKMSKSLGNVLSIETLTQDFPAAAVRWRFQRCITAVPSSGDPTLFRMQTPPGRSSQLSLPDQSRPLVQQARKNFS